MLQLGRIITNENEVLVFLESKLIYAYSELYDEAIKFSKNLTFTTFQDGFGIFENSKDIVNFTVLNGHTKDFEFNRFSYDYDSLEVIATELKRRIEVVKEWSFSFYKKVEYINFTPNGSVNKIEIATDNTSIDNPDNIIAIGEKYKYISIDKVVTVSNITEEIVELIWFFQGKTLSINVNKIDFINSIRNKNVIKLAKKKKYLCTTCNKHYVKQAMLDEGKGITPTICINCYARSR